LKYHAKCCMIACKITCVHVSLLGFLVIPRHILTDLPSTGYAIIDIDPAYPA